MSTVTTTEAGARLFKRRLQKPDGRALWLYARSPLADDFIAPAPPTDGKRPNPHLRRHPLRGEWVAYAGHRQNRTFLPPQEFNPLAPTTNPDAPTELPAGRYDVAVFENLFPALVASAHDPPQTILPTRPARGSCEVVVFTQDPATSLGRLPLAQLEIIFDVWADRYEELGRRDDVEYVFPFENRGVEVGVTLAHPHGQIYAYPFVPPVAARELELQRAYWDAHGTGLFGDLVDAEILDGERLLYVSPEAAAFVPACARYPYETWVAPRAPRPSLASLTLEERVEMARALKTALMKLDGLWSRPMPYMLVIHQAPTDGRPHPEAHVHVEIYPVHRAPGRMKYAAGSETGAGVFTADALPEASASQLRAVEVTLG